MHLSTCHFGLQTHDLSAAYSFYVELLGFPVLQHDAALGLLALRVGNVRLSVFATGTVSEITRCSAQGANIILRCDDLDAVASELRAKGVLTVPQVRTAPGFMRWVEIVDPSGNAIAIAEYARDPLEPA